MTRALPVVLAVLVASGPTAGYAATVFVDAVLADVKGTIVTASDATIARGLGLFGIRQSEEPILAADVTRLVDAWLIDAEAARLQIGPSAAEIEEAWEAAAARIGGTDALRGWLDQARLDEAWVRRLIEADLRWQRFIEVRFRAFAFVTDEDVAKVLGPDPRDPEVREKVVNRLREEIADRELQTWLAEARSRATIRITGAEGTGLAPLFPLPKGVGALP